MIQKSCRWGADLRMNSGSYISKYSCYVITHNRKLCQLCLTVVVLVIVVVFTRHARPAELEQKNQYERDTAVRS
jgi:5-methylcytosine-specific restriction endonuclease McrA